MYVVLGKYALSKGLLGIVNCLSFFLVLFCRGEECRFLEGTDMMGLWMKFIIRHVASRVLSLRPVFQIRHITPRMGAVKKT